MGDLLCNTAEFGLLWQRPALGFWESLRRPGRRGEHRREYSHPSSLCPGRQLPERQPCSSGRFQKNRCDNCQLRCYHVHFGKASSGTAHRRRQRILFCGRKCGFHFRGGQQKHEWSESEQDRLQPVYCGRIQSAYISIIGDNRGYVSVNFGSGTNTGFILFGPNGQSEEDGGGGAVILNEQNAYKP